MIYIFTLYLVILFQLTYSSKELGADRCFLDKRSRKHVLPDLCGCTGVITKSNIRYNIILPPHAGTDTLTDLFYEILNVTSCHHEHTDLTIHEKELSEFYSSNYCILNEEQDFDIKKNKNKKEVMKPVFVDQDASRAPIKQNIHWSKYSNELCNTKLNKEILIAIVRSPYSRLVTGYHYMYSRNQNGRHDKSQKNNLIKKFQSFVVGGKSGYIKPLSKMMFSSKEKQIIKPDYFINNTNHEQYLYDVINIIKILGFKKEIISLIQNKMDPKNGFGHHITPKDIVPISLVEYYNDDNIVNIVLERYKDDFELYNLEKNVSLI